MGDFNSHSPFWDSYKLDTRGEIWEQLLEDPDMVILNKK